MSAIATTRRTRYDTITTTLLILIITTATTTTATTTTLALTLPPTRMATRQSIAASEANNFKEQTANYLSI
uniref:Uncharacterized protein n=1 Tax=Glossina brevipalpis TaxID=37001 RepID=A0A1A9WNP7_9MUSC